MHGALYAVHKDTWDAVFFQMSLCLTNYGQLAPKILAISSVAKTNAFKDFFVLFMVCAIKRIGKDTHGHCFFPREKWPKTSPKFFRRL